jgi:hypothetical protein
MPFPLPGDGLATAAFWVLVRVLAPTGGAVAVGSGCAAVSVFYSMGCLAFGGCGGCGGFARLAATLASP